MDNLDDRRDDGREHGPNMDERRRLLVAHHRQTLWVYWLLVFLGLWMIAAPLTFSYATGTVTPSGGRETWLTLAQRITWMTRSDVVSGLLLIYFGWRSLTPGRPISLWICCFVGIWLTFAPLVLWAPTATAYLNDTCVGALVIAASVLIPGMPNMIMYMKMGGDQPPGWSYCPSSWPQRSILIGLAFAGWLVSRYLAAYQLGYVDRAWDPCFGAGTRLVLDSDMSHTWPVSDAGFGAAAYTFEFLMGFMGASSRWRTMPWMVLFFGILVIPLGLVHIVLVIAQPVIVGHWCTLCLLAAAIMLPMIPLMVDEVIAMGQHMLDARNRGHGLWQVFWRGGPTEGATNDERTPQLLELPNHPGALIGAALRGMSSPWTLLAASVLGVWSMFTPAAMGVSGAAASLFQLCGALIVVVSVITMGEPLRIGRFLNLVLALILGAGVWWVSGAELMAQLDGVAVAVLVAGLSVPRGPVHDSYGRWDRFVR